MLARDFRQQLAANCTISAPHAVSRHVSADGMRK